MNPIDGIDDRVNIDKTCIYLSQVEWEELEKEAMAAQMKAHEESERRCIDWN